MPPPAAPAETPLEFTAEQDVVLRELSRNMQLVALLGLGQAALWIAGGLLAWFWAGAGFFQGLFFLLVGALVGFFGLVFLSTSADAGYIVDTQGNDKVHFLNMVAGLKVYLNAQLLLASLLVVVLVCRLFI